MAKKKEPKYKYIQNDLRQQIIAGKFKYGDKFYTEAELVDSYNVSSITVIRALKELENEGFLDRQQGVGTFVSRSRKEKLVKFSDIEFFPTSNDSVTVLSMEKGNKPYYLDKLQLHKSEFYYKIIRVRYNNSTPYVYHQSYLPHDYILNPDSPLEKYDSIYRRFRHDFGIHLSEENFTETNEIIFPSPDEPAKYLKLTSSEPAVLQIKRTLSKENERVLEYTETYKHWQYYKFEISSSD
ncbi:GntR family transcriptional regulator [Streptococcus chenjunshii]|uniref:GntR family transcriptional regulator n=1 Tax=Streptococcus chenjunshii TaxID=2173853 RepID=A0A372KPF3_9STRE|nr:GntR family transcriptional regulator [Streptococcus chenjunshii]AXQ78149.1 GntR family transcriptional regulator [Streptococcus chenjunshii]RFU50706.1 GntR family transcriptional regulator [Streptococcus chenjunshii]RFU53478.1 GntR family transcriptional regulator [Streptococcus chenjunshii]